ncbi:MAG: hypothetical protein IPK81_19195 [Rhodospirillales bacterium]|nr:MAG: hypothetical protein IPK81_19195 [Rhodospirillales bacterium]
MPTRPTARSSTFAVLATVLLSSAAAAQSAPDHVWSAVQADKGNWRSIAVARPAAFMEPRGLRGGAILNVVCSVENREPALRLHYADPDIGHGPREWRGAMSARIDAQAPVELEHVDRGDWLSRPLSPGVVDSLRAGNAVVVDRAAASPGRAAPPLRLHLRGSEAAMQALLSLCML